MKLILLHEMHAHNCGPKQPGETWKEYGDRIKNCPACATEGLVSDPEWGEGVYKDWSNPLLYSHSRNPFKLPERDWNPRKRKLEDLAPEGLRELMKKYPLLSRNLNILKVFFTANLSAEAKQWDAQEIDDTISYFGHVAANATEKSDKTDHALDQIVNELFNLPGCPFESKEDLKKMLKILTDMPPE